VWANLAFAAVATIVALIWFVTRDDIAVGEPQPVTAALATATSAATTTSPPPTTIGTTTTTRAPTTTTTSTTTTAAPYDGWVDPSLVGVPASETVEGVLTFRGSPTRTYYGEGPVPDDPEVLWSFPGSAMCSESTSGGVTRTWCGTGWTGQPAVWEKGGRTWLAFGAYDRAIHVLDAASGTRILDDFVTGDIIKGSVTIDPDGFPILYSGSRDGFFRAIALDRGKDPVELWRLSADAVSPTKWNGDWDGAALVIDDYLFEGGENSQLHIVKLNRGYDEDGFVTVDPELVFNAPGWDNELIRAVGNNVSIENSVAISGNTLYFSNSGGLVQGWDIAGLAEGTQPVRTFRYWVGDDTDATIVIDEDGFLYVGAEYERALDRAREVGQFMKLDPSNPDDPLVWSIADDTQLNGGIWATAALHRDIVIVATNGGRVLGIDQITGDTRWTLNLPGPLWQSPVVVDNVLIQGDCTGRLRAFDVSDTTVEPPQLWSLNIGGCIESTPVVWRGVIYVGTRSGKVHAIG
jgi:hypothetical protein